MGALLFDPTIAETDSHSPIELRADGQHPVLGAPYLWMNFGRYGALRCPDLLLDPTCWVDRPLRLQACPFIDKLFSYTKIEGSNAPGA